MSVKEHVIKERERHHAALQALAKSINPNSKITGLMLWRKLQRIEREAHASTTAYCNGEIGPDAMDAAAFKASFAVRNLFGDYPPRFHVNRDPRGYALKLLSSDDGSEPATPFDLHQDWGRNQILAPEIN